MGFMSWQSQLLLVGAGLAYLVIAHNKKYFPFNPGGPADTATNLLSVGDDSTDDTPSKTPAPAPSPFLNGPTNPINPRQQLDLGNGFAMPIPPGGTSSGNGYLPGQRGPTMPLVSTVANDPTPTDYGIYTQYLNGLRQEYQKMTDANQQAQSAQIGIGGDITTLPQPPTVGAVPYGYNAGLPPPPFMPQFPPGPLPFQQPPPFMLPPPPRGWRRVRHPRGFLIDIGPSGQMNIPGINIDIGNLLHLGIGGGNGGINLGIGGGQGGLFGGGGSDSQSGGLLGGLFGSGGLLGGILGGGGNNGLFNGIGGIFGSGTSGASTPVNIPGANINLSGLPSQQDLQTQIQNQVKQSLANSGINVSFAASDVTDEVRNNINDVVRNARDRKIGRNKATFIQYEQNVKPPQIPADFNGIKPTLFNMVSRNQPMGLMAPRLGNI